MSVLTRWASRRCGGLAAAYEHYTAPLEAAGLTAVRASLAGDLSGSILEIGCGTGLNFPHYPPGVRVTAIEPLEEFRLFAAERARAAAACITVVDGDALALAFADHSFDAALGTLVFCSVPDARRGLREVRRVLRPAAPVRFIEHVRSDRVWAALLQHFCNPLWRRLMDGCNLNRDTVATIRDAGFTIDDVHPCGVCAPGAAFLPMRVIRGRA